MERPRQASALGGEDDYYSAMLALRGAQSRVQEQGALAHAQIGVSVTGGASGSTAPCWVPYGGQAAAEGCPPRGPLQGGPMLAGPSAGHQRTVPAPAAIAPAQLYAAHACTEEGSAAPTPSTACSEDGLQKLWRDWSRQLSYRVASRPLCCVASGLGIVLLTITIGMVAMPMDIETNFDSFLKTDVESAIRRNAFIMARDAREAYSRRLQEVSAPAPTPVYMSKDLLIAYELTENMGSEGIFGTQAISAIVHFEESLRHLPGWMELCSRAAPQHRSLCDPGASFANYMLPTPRSSASGSIIPSALALDGHGWDVAPTRTALMLAERHQLDRLLLPTSVNSSGHGPLFATTIRSAFRFTVLCCNSENSFLERREATQEFTRQWHTFATEVLMPILREGLPEQNIRIWYQGSDFQEFEVKEALSGDISLAVVSLFFVFLYLLLHTRSLLLSVMGPIIALLSVPLTYVICAALFGVTRVSFANFLAFFLIVGFGADVIFVYTDFWRASKDQVAGGDHAERLAWTFHQASKTCFATISTTAISFLANLASVIRALRQFGFFMGLCVMLAWVLVLLLYTPLCVADENLCRGRRRCLGPAGCAKSRCFEWWAGVLNRYRRVVSCLSLFLFGLFLATAIPNATRREGLPSIFPEGHNQNQGQEVFEQFLSAAETFDSKFQPPPKHAEVCTAGNVSSGPSSCDLYWCEAASPRGESRPPWNGQNGTCECRRRILRNCGNSTLAPATLRLVGPGEVTKTHQDAIVQYWLETGMPVDFAQSQYNLNGQIPALVIQEWETGRIDVERVVQVSANMQRRNLLTSTCGWQDICFCSGQLRCSLVGWERVSSELALPVEPMPQEPVRRLAPEYPLRRLDVVSPGLPASLRAKVRVIFGLEVAEHISLLSESSPSEAWSFRPGFDLKQPWAQRNLYNFCKETPKELKVARSWCWMEDFRLYAHSQGWRFPVRTSQFHEAALEYAERGVHGTRGYRYLWVMGSDVQALYVSFEVDVHKRSSVSQALEYKAKWDAYLDEYNAKAWRVARGAFHVSQLWVTAESQGHLVSSTVQTMLILIILAFLSMLAITRSLVLSSFVVCATLFVMSGLAFFAIVLMGWEIGLIEVVAIIFFIGYALDYSLHIAHKYASSDALKPHEVDEDRDEIRLQRTTFALRSIGGAVLSSAVTTAGASMFLTFCTLTIFRKLGSMCLTVTLISIAAALGPLPALLLWNGPKQPGRGCGTRFLSDLGAGGSPAGVEPRARE